MNCRYQDENDTLFDIRLLQDSISGLPKKLSLPYLQLFVPISFQLKLLFEIRLPI
jgi:hypothetical protein